MGRRPKNYHEIRDAERKSFMRTLARFQQPPVESIPEPMIGDCPVDFYSLFKAVAAYGGFNKVNDKRWQIIASDPEVLDRQDSKKEISITEAGQTLKYLYTQQLLPYEMANSRQLSSLAPPKSSNFPPIPSIAPKLMFRGRQQPQGHPQKYSSTKILAGEPLKLRESYMDPSHKNRVFLALESGLPNEVDWAFNTLVMVSYRAGSDFKVCNMPTLVETLIRFGHDALDEIDAAFYEEDNGNPHFRSLKPQTRTPAFLAAVHRVSQVVTILRNLSFLAQNVVVLGREPSMGAFLVRCLGVEQPPPHKVYAEVRGAALDILEEIGSKLHMKRQLGLKCINYLLAMLHDDDRFFILGAINSLAHLALHPENDRFAFDVDEKNLERIMQLLLLDDEELQQAILEFLNKYSVFSEDTSYRLAHLHSVNSVKMLFQICHELYQDPDVFPTLEHVLASQPVSVAEMEGANAREAEGDMDVDSTTDKGKKRAEGEDPSATPTISRASSVIPRYPTPLPKLVTTEEPRISSRIMTAASILKNLSSHPPNVKLFEEYEPDLVIFSTIPGKLGALASKIIADITHST